MSNDRMQRQRFELKYMLDEDQAIASREFLAAHLELDENGVGKPNFSYPVHSLYLDYGTLDTFWATINGDKNRYKLRLRFYNDQPGSPVFFEIKRRVNNCILKQRGGIRKDAVPWLLAGYLPAPEQVVRTDPKSLSVIQNFLKLAERLHARLLAHVAYLREAYVDPVSDNVRVTLDRAVRTEARTEPIFTTTMQNSSLPFGDRVILELKFTDRFPGWCRQLVQRFGLMQCGAAKYCEGLAGLPEFGVSHAGDLRETPQSQHSASLKLVFAQDAHVGLEGDHTVAREKILAELLQEMVGGLGLDDDFDLDVGELRDVRRALAARAVAFDGEKRVAVRADFVEQFDHRVLRVGFANDRNELHGVEVHGFKSRGGGRSPGRSECPG